MALHGQCLSHRAAGNAGVTLACGCPTRLPDWNDRNIDLGGHCALIHPIPTLFHMPLAYEAYLQRQQEEVTKLELPELWPGFVITQTGMLRGRLIRLLENTHSPSRHVVYLSQPFNLQVKVHFGDVGSIRAAVRSMQMALLDNGKLPKELYLSYLTCPHCQHDRGGAQVMLLRRWVESSRLKQKMEKLPR